MTSNVTTDQPSSEKRLFCSITKKGYAEFSKALHDHFGNDDSVNTILAFFCESFRFDPEIKRGYTAKTAEYIRRYRQRKKESVTA